MMGHDREPRDYARLAARALEPPAIEPAGPGELGRRKQAVEALAAALQARSRKRLRRRRLLAVGGVAALALASVGLLTTWSGTPVPAVQVEGGSALQAGSVVRASRGRSVGLALATGTRVRLTGGRLDLAELGVRQRFVLQSGRFWAKVAPLTAGQRFLVVTPDVEVEVRGTVFELFVVPPRPECDGAATEVRVIEGLVTVRRNGRQWQIPAGQGWPGDCRPPATPAVAPAAAVPERLAEPTIRRSPRPAAVASTLAEQNQLFGTAMDARRRGDLAEARRRLDELLARFPFGALADSARRVLAGLPRADSDQPTP